MRVGKGGYVANCAEVAVDKTTGEVTIVRVVVAFECGAIVNPDGLRNQVLGGNIQGLGGALFEAIEFENGRVLNPKFSKYRVPRFKDVPPIEVVLIESQGLATGRSRRSSADGSGAFNRKCHLRCNRCASALTADDSIWDR